MIAISKRKNILLPMLILILVIESYFFKINLEEILSLKENITSVQLKLKKMKDIISKKKLLEVKESRRETIKKSLPKQLKLNQFLVQLESLIDKQGIILNNFRPQDELKEKGFIRLPIELFLSGSYQDIVSLLSSLESLERLIKVSSISIKDNNNNRLSLRLVLNIFALAGSDTDEG